MDGRLLIIDDDAEVRELLSLLLGKHYSVLQASGGEEGLALLAQERVRLVLLDIAMPHMDGLQVLQAALKADKTLQIIMLTSQHEIDIARNALEIGAAAYITKPFDCDQLKAEVDRAMALPQAGVADARPWRRAD